MAFYYLKLFCGLFSITLKATTLNKARIIIQCFVMFSRTVSNLAPCLAAEVDLHRNALQQDQTRKNVTELIEIVYAIGYGIVLEIDHRDVIKNLVEKSHIGANLQKNATKMFLVRIAEVEVLHLAAANQQVRLLATKSNPKKGRPLSRCPKRSYAKTLRLRYSGKCSFRREWFSSLFFTNSFTFSYYI